jgi:hypothetical protein
MTAYLSQHRLLPYFRLGSVLESNPMRKWRNIVLILLAVGILAYLGHWAYVQVFLIDRCLDRGGSWDYDAEVCDGARDAAPL